MDVARTADQPQDFGIAERHVARAVRIRQASKTDAPCPAVADALVMAGGEIERCTQPGAGSIDGCGRHLGQQVIAPFAQLGRGERTNQPGRQSGGKMPAHVLGVGGVAAAGAQIGFILIERFGDA